MRELVARYLSNGISRRDFVGGLVKCGLSLAAAESVLQSVNAVAQSGGAPLAPDAVRLFQGTASASLAEQLMASGVKYIFGSSASEDAEFYEALTDRPQLTYILTPHEGPGAAMAAGFVKASGQPAFAMETGAVGLMNSMGQMFNAFKEQTPLVFYAYHREDSRAAGRDGFEELPGLEQVVAPLTKESWLARRPDAIAETIRRAFKVSWTPPYGPTFATWHTDFNRERVRTEVIVQQQVDPRMRVRPNPIEVERAARLLLEAERPVLIVGDEIYKARAVDKAIALADTLGLAVTQARQVHVSFPQSHPLWVGAIPGDRIDTLTFPAQPDLVINVGNKLQVGTPAPFVARGTTFIDMRIDAANMGNVMTTDVPLVSDVGYGMDDLLSAVNSLMTPALRSRIQARAEPVRTFSARARQLRRLVSRNPDWNRSPLLADRLTYEIAQWADPTAIIVHEAGSVELSHSFEFNPSDGRDLFFYYGAHLGSGVGTAAGVKLARPDRQVVCLVGDGSFVFGPTALWNMARLGLPVVVIVYNNHAYSGPHNRVVGAVPDGRLVQTGKFVHDFLGKPNMDMASIARGFGVDAERVETLDRLAPALARARKATTDGKPYLLDVEVARTGPAWSADPWVPTLSARATQD